MNKQELLNEIEKLKAKVEALEDEKTVTPKTGRVFTSQGFKEGYRINGSGEIFELFGLDIHTVSDYLDTGHIFYDEDSAIKYVEYLKLWQRARDFMAKDWGNEVVDWSNTNQPKFCLVMNKYSVTSLYSLVYAYHPLHFKTEQSRSHFREQFSDDEIKLMLMGV